MPQNRAQLEAQRARAKDDLELREKQLKEKGISGEDCQKDARWKHFKARCTKINARLYAVAAVEARDAQAEQRKAEQAAQ